MHNVQNRFGLFPGRSPLLGESLLFSLPAGTKMFQFPAFACPQKITDMHRLHPCGLPHSEIRASTAMCTYARLIAAYHVLHRLCEPRHPPYALTYFRLKLPTYIYIIKTQRTRTSGSPYFKLYYLNLHTREEKATEIQFLFLQVTKT